MDWSRQIEENEYEYIYRICSQKEAIGTWQDIADILNAQLSYEYSESCYRKQYQMFSRMLESNKERFSTSEDYIEELKQQEDKLYRLKKQTYDQRREYNKVLTTEARAEHLESELLSVAKNLNKERPLVFLPGKEFGECEGLIALADWHYGMVADNIWNKYNVSICESRIKDFVSKAKTRLNTHKPKVLHILLLGDFANGAIHSTSRVESEELTCDQLMHASELIAQTICGLANYRDDDGGAEEVYVYSSYGNHMRTVQLKNDSVHADNMEKIIPWWLKQRFQDTPKVKIVEADYKEFIRLDVCGYKICAVHGDLDKIDDIGVTANTIFSKKYGETIDYTISADKHHLESFESFGIESCLVRSLCGTDSFANKGRLYSLPGQTLMIFTPEEGKDGVYNIKTL